MYCCQVGSVLGHLPAGILIEASAASGFPRKKLCRFRLLTNVWDEKRGPTHALCIHRQLGA